jgi:murein DD-endopeptidase MepM/ murein hydrolase activator NlpD
MSPPQPDRSHLAGNHVILDCVGTWVVLGHLQRGSVVVRQGDTVPSGAAIGSVGNSGNTGEPFSTSTPNAPELTRSR